MSNRQYPAIPHPTSKVESLHETTMALKEAVEILTNQRGANQKVTSVVTWQDLINLGLITSDQVPRQ